jgi:hypothetical protein
MVFMNPFKAHDVSDFPGVLIPLREAQPHHSVVEKHDEKLETTESPIDEESASIDQYSPHTIEGLKAEVELDLAASGHDTAYDSM